MGDRGQVRFIFSHGDEDVRNDVWFYTHWGASDLVSIVQSALRRGKGRWDDDEYLARIVFCEMVGGDVHGTTGYGIGMSRHGDVWQVITVDTTGNTVTVEEPPIGPVSFEVFAEGGIQMLAEAGRSDE